ncbi:taste receptor type 2 member 1-like [Triplophysa rosa]|uniref:Taste receptor type 2 n=1 Tax=Triplophysa rosa TaxID=992332 RepID=A0A9W7WUI6_TRIRA|nr:taste receptor type 2 member 1-like [Triplophysa rosa]KAI7808772.1 taste receptor [Triplophysa rosa]
MSSIIVEMSPLAFAIVNVPVSVATTLMNMFFIYCMFSSQDGSEICQKPPLNVLVGSLIGCNLLLNICNLVFVIYKTVDVPVWAYIVSCALILYAMRTSFTASLGLNVFYYFQIVPARHPCLIWVKTRIKLFMYFMLVFDRIFFSFGFILQVLPGRVFISAVDFNSSSILTSRGLILRYYLILTDFWLRCCYCFICLGIMVASNTSTVLYLWKHVKSMENSSSSSALHYRKQKRVTTLSIIQTVLFFFSSGWLITEELMFRFNINFNPTGHVLFSIVACYAFGTTVILGVGQSKFRLRAVDIVKKLGRIVLRSNLNVGDVNVNFRLSDTGKG